MATSAEVIAGAAMRLFDGWAVGHQLVDDDLADARTLRAGVHRALARHLSESEGWPLDWGTEGIIPYRTVRLDPTTIELIGVVAICDAALQEVGRIPIRVVVGVDPSDQALMRFEAALGNWRINNGRPVLDSRTAMVVVDESGVPELLDGRRMLPISWSRPIDLSAA